MSPFWPTPGRNLTVPFDITGMIRENVTQVKLGGFHTDDFSFSFYVPILSTKDDHFFHANRNIDKAVSTAVELERFSN